MIANMGLIPL